MRAITATLFAGVLLLSMQTGSFAQNNLMPDGVKVTGAALTDSKGMTLYTFDYDTTPGQSACAGACLVQWPALAAGADAKPMGDWTAISRDDGTKQWAYKGKPLYTFYQDTKPGDQKGDGNAQIWHSAIP
jgi:predicted lipoprotein with Yx(FWY)xxD motif